MRSFSSNCNNCVAEGFLTPHELSPRRARRVTQERSRMRIHRDDQIVGFVSAESYGRRDYRGGAVFGDDGGAGVDSTGGEFVAEVDFGFESFAFEIDRGFGSEAAELGSTA